MWGFCMCALTASDVITHMSVWRSLITELLVLFHSKMLASGWRWRQFHNDRKSMTKVYHSGNSPSINMFRSPLWKERISISDDCQSATVIFIANLFVNLLTFSFSESRWIWYRQVDSFLSFSFARPEKKREERRATEKWASTNCIGVNVQSIVILCSLTGQSHWK